MPQALPRISLEAIAIWRAAGIRVTLIRVSGGYLVQVR